MREAAGSNPARSTILIGSETIEGDRPVLRDAKQEDREALRRIIESSFRHGIYTYFANRSLDSAPKIVVAVADGEVVGFAEPKLVKIGGRVIGNILWIAIRPELRRKGVGLILVEECIKILSSDGASEIFVSVERDNPPAFAMFARAGFKRIGFRELTKEFGMRVLSFYNKLLIAPNEIVMVRPVEPIREPSST